jgi:hypothetical protein
MAKPSTLVPQEKPLVFPPSTGKPKVFHSPEKNQ